MSRAEYMRRYRQEKARKMECLDCKSFVVPAEGRRCPRCHVRNVKSVARHRRGQTRRS